MKKLIVIKLLQRSEHPRSELEESAVLSGALGNECSYPNELSVRQSSAAQITVISSRIIINLLTV